jgi:hypothetical protein
VVIRTTIVSTREIVPICLAFGSVDFRYLIVQPIKSGGRSTLTRYNPICVQMPVERGFSFTFFPQTGQKKAVLSIVDEQNGQTI